MPTRLIFDIETVGVDFETLDSASQEYLLKYAESPEEEEEAKRGLSFSPLTGQIVAIGILNPDTDRGAVYFQAPDQQKFEEEGVQYFPATEKEILENFWEVMRHYDQIITFNGRMFDCPYIMIRSGILKVKPTKNLMPNRYYDEHIDLYDRLSFFGAMRRKMNLHMWCQALGIKSPKSDGITGDNVGPLFKEKKYKEIAQYCFGDLRATKELLAYWEKYINIK
ncbi:MAG: ribonuclease H-like domain-containing protein [Candidatus Yanofskybacteria bacterium]|nr:ribonuclease H-like domain-containing protein [Candidatus Yanofskybacteria bacterium]